MKPGSAPAFSFRRSFVLLALTSATLVAQPSIAKEAAPASGDALLEQFRNPPPSARPRVWWHWVNGNITEDGINKDIEWMARIGIGGAQIFDVARPMPSMVEKPLPYMSPAWRSAFGAAATKADTLGIELGVASSPGWSETGAPWVGPDDAMKKVVWSSIEIAGGKRFVGNLPKPPDVSGPFQELDADTHHGSKTIHYYRDALVLALPRDPLTGPVRAGEALINGAATDPDALQDGYLDTGVAFPRASRAEPGTVQYSFDKARTVRSARLFIANAPGSVLSGPFTPRLEASEDGKVWQTVGTFTQTSVPSTISFPEVSARHFRLLLTYGMPGPINFSAAPGVDLRMAAGLGGEVRAPIIAEFQLSSDPRVNAFEQKAAFAYADNYYALDSDMGDDLAAPDPDSVLDLTGRMDASGRLDWKPPRGNWRILRIGYSLTGKTNAPASPEATGLEVDKYDRGAVERYVARYLENYRAITGPELFGRRGLTNLVTDSIEVRPANWTPGIVTAFKRMRGYDPRPWMPSLTGMVIGSRNQSDAFLHDFRKTLGELIETEHYGTIARVARREKLTLYGEALEGNRQISALGDDLDLRRHADIPMGAMWTFTGKEAAPHYRADMRGAASVAHLYGKPIVAAEVLTSILQPWAYSPADLQPMIDAAFLAGVNRPVIHSVVHQPRDDKRPGLSLQGFGQFFGRHETWAEMAKPWMDYIARTSFLLQQGRNVADVAYFYGEDTPISVIAAKGFPADVPQRNAYDFISPSGLAELSVENGELVSSGRARYRALYLGGTSRQMTLPVLERIAKLVEAGANVIGMRPQATPSLADDPARFEEIATKLWSGSTGDGRILETQNVETALGDLGVNADFTVSGGNEDTDVRFVHRTLADGDVYFVSNRRSMKESIEAHFRIGGRIPTIWKSETGSVSQVGFRTESSHTIVPLTMEPNESFFVIFRQPTTARKLAIQQPTFKTITGVAGPWTVSFESGLGAPPPVKLDELRSLSENKLEGVRFFSGTTTYETSFALPQNAENQEGLVLDLGKVGDIAEVQVNGRIAGTAWKAPFRVDISGLVKSGSNELRIKVANRWINRLIGDAQDGADKVAFTLLPTYRADAKLQPSGLIGPVEILGNSN
ncbi:MAG: glycosyl hydrolase [Novosphingobium sp.]|nr:glycosyl hydrolase [Novosphingobium sp.]